MTAIDWGDAPTWLGAFFAAGAATAAVWTLASQRIQLREQREFIALQAANLTLERSALQAAAEERRSEQARQIVNRAVVSLVTPHDRDTGEPYVLGPLCWRVEVGNASREPIRDVSVRLGSNDLRWASEIGSFDSHTPGWERPSAHSVRAPVPLLGSGTSYVFVSDEFEQMPTGLERPVCYFTDNSGVSWRLDGYGDLAEATGG